MMNNEELELNKEQECLFHLMEDTKKNIFISGKAGTGKSFIINYFVEHTKKSVAVLSYMGLAAANVNGMTINKFFAIGIEELYEPEEVLHKLEGKAEYFGVKKRLAKLDCLIIDEISTCRIDLFNTIEFLCRELRQDQSFFGGIQVFLVGDLLQIPPVAQNAVRKLLKDRYDSLYFFKNKDIMYNNVMGKFPLRTIHRQSDPLFKEILNRVRVGKNTQDDLRLLNSRCITPPEDAHFVSLTTKNAQADEINEAKLRELPGEAKTYVATVEGTIDRGRVQAPEILALKEGAQVIMLVNHPDGYYMNGSIGIITHLDTNFIRVKIKDKEYEVDRFTWTPKSYDLVDNKLTQVNAFTFTQFPVKLAWAMSIHKSQGMTYDSVRIIPLDAFDTGQIYVALSRCRSLEGLYLTDPIKQSYIKVDQQVLKFLNGEE